jgi:hypothetical protein
VPQRVARVRVEVEPDGSKCLLRLASARRPLQPPANRRAICTGSFLLHQGSVQGGRCGCCRGGPRSFHTLG